MIEDLRSRFPTFSPGYRARWISSGLWLDRTLHDLFEERAAEDPERVALITPDRKITFREFKERSDALAAGLLRAGIGPGHIVSVQLPNLPELCFLQIALSRIGAVIHPMHVVLREREIGSLLRFCESDAVVVPESFEGFGHAEAIREMRADLPALKLLVVVGGKARGPGEAYFDDLVGDGLANVDPLKTVEADPDDSFYLNFTSGTEGEPKGFLHTHNTLISFFKRVADFLRMSDPDGVILCSSPMTHSFGHFTTYQTALAGVPMVLIAKYRPLDLLQLIEREKVTSLSGTPAHLIGILHHPDFGDYDTSSITSVSVGGARSPRELLEEIEKVWGVASANTYGMGENIAHTRTMPFDPPEKAQDTVGRALPGTEIRIVGEDRVTDLPPGRVGEIAFRGPTLFAGYYKQPDLTRETRTEEGWFFTGDLGFLDEEAFLTVVGRQTEMINRGGTKIFPKEIEDLLLAHPKVEDVGVVGMPDFRLGERVCAYVVSRGGQELTLEELASYLQDQRIAKHKIPEDLVVVDELPMTPSGKVQKVRLMEDAVRRAEAAEQRV